MPAVIGALIYVYVDYRYGRVGFGGNKAISNWIGFGFTQPATFVYALPVFGFAAEVIAVTSGRRLPSRGLMFTGIALIGIIAALGGVLQQPVVLPPDVTHTSFGGWLKAVTPYALFDLLPMLGGFIVIVLGAHALRRGRTRITMPLVFALLGALMVYVGIFANAVYNIGNLKLADTVFEEGTWLFVVYGAVLSALGAITYWGPKLWGRRIPDKPALPLAVLGLIATVLAGVPLLHRRVRRPAGQLHRIRLLRAAEPVERCCPRPVTCLMFITVLGFAFIAVRAFRKGTRVGDDPWDGQTLEWATSSPAPLANFADVHVVSSAEPLLDLKPRRDLLMLALPSAAAPAPRRQLFVEHRGRLRRRRIPHRRDAGAVAAVPSSRLGCR